MKQHNIRVNGDDPILRKPEVLHRVGSRSSAWLYREIAAGRFPRPIKLSSRAVGWRSSVVNQWIADKEAAGWVPEPQPGARKTATESAAV